MNNISRSERRKQQQKGKSKVFRYLYIVLIVAGLGILGYSGTQWFLVRQHQDQLRESYEATAGFRNIFEGDEGVEISEFEPMRLFVPAIDVDLIVEGDVDTYDPDQFGSEPWRFSQVQYQQWLEGLNPLLDRGPVYYQFSDLPSTEGGNVVIAGHRAGRWNFFRYLDELEKGDHIYLEVAGYRFSYLVEEVAQVDANDWSMLRSTEKPAITLQTCAPLGVPDPPYRLNARGYLDGVSMIRTNHSTPDTPEVD